jgi:hypothetical protein
VENSSARVKKIAAAAANQKAILGCATDEDIGIFLVAREFAIGGAVRCCCVGT